MTGRASRLTDRIAALRAAGRGGLSIYLCGGHPSVQATGDLLDAAVAGGADWLELGIPFSDPAADGPVIQAAATQALENGCTVQDILAIARAFRGRHPEVPVIAMTYANLAFQRGWEGFARDLAEAGIDGLILPDVPLEESGPIRAALAAAGLAWVPLVTPTTPADRMAALAATATGFLYVVGNVGITGQSDPGPLVEATVARARAADPDVPLAVGFGISSADDVRRVLGAGADAAIVGSKVVGAVTAGATPEQIRSLVKGLAQG
ncbi:MAG: tryptophan synthase subunit alpha [Thermoplasmatota archaeon]